MADQLPGTQTTLFPLCSMPGVKRDGTILEGNYYTDAQHCRWQRGKPRKMGGYREITADAHGPCRGSSIFSQDGITYVYNGWSHGLEQFQVDSNDFGTPINDRTPAAFTASDDNVWQFDLMFNAAVGAVNTTVLAHAAPNLSNIDSSVATPVWYGAATETGAFVTTTATSVSGGVCCIQPYAFVYGSDGYISWSDINQPTKWSGGDSGDARVAGAKIVKGMQTRGGPGNAPAGLFWSLDSVIRVSYVGSPSIFRFDTITDQSSVLSSSAIIEYDGLFFWPGTSRFLVYNGVVQELPNQMNLNYFFDNLNWSMRQKVWAMKIPRFGEIWWFYPSGTNTECDRAVIYNVREQTWYDTELSRCSGYYSQSTRYPLMFEGDQNSNGTYSLWAHEVGVDKVQGGRSLAIPSWFQTSVVGFTSGGPAAGLNGPAPVPGNNRWARLTRFEPDFVQSGEMSLVVRGRNYANGVMQDSDPIPFDSSTTKLDLREQRRQMYLKFISNEVGGNYQTGRPLFNFELGDIHG